MEPKYGIDSIKANLWQMCVENRVKSWKGEYHDIFPGLDKHIGLEAAIKEESEYFKEREYAIAYAEYKLGFITEQELKELYGFSEVTEN